MSRPLYVYGLAVVGTFAILGAGLGLAANFTLGFFIEQFVDPGTDPLDVTQVGIMFLVSILFIYALGPIAAGVAGIAVGQALPDRETAAGVVAGVGSFVGFYLFVGLALFLTFSVLSEYGGGMGGGGGEEVEGEAQGGGGPLDPSALVTLMIQVSLPVGLVGLATAYITSRVSGAVRDRGPGTVKQPETPDPVSPREEPPVLDSTPSQSADPPVSSESGSSAGPPAGDDA